MLPRNLSSSLPAAALLVAWLLTSLGRRAGVVATAIVLTAVAFGGAQMLGDANQRPPYRDAARFIDARAHSGDPVANFAFAAARVPSGTGPANRFVRRAERHGRGLTGVLVAE